MNKELTQYSNCPYVRVGPPDKIFNIDSNLINYVLSVILQNLHQFLLHEFLGLIELSPALRTLLVILIKHKLIETFLTVRMLHHQANYRARQHQRHILIEAQTASLSRIWVAWRLLVLAA